MTAYTDNNPKTIYGAAKPDFSLIPPSVLVYLALGWGEGARKYGPYNWRENQVSARTYVAAAMRHLAAFLDGEDIDPVDAGPNCTAGSGLPHLAHALASIGILVDAIETGNVVDDRPKPGAGARLIRQWTKMVPKAPAPAAGAAA